MRFLVDGMLGGLARWLRILGQDVRYDASTEDNELLRIAYEENMVLLTRDEELYQRAIARRIPSALVVGETEEKRLAQIASIFNVHLDVDMTETRCPECGSDLKVLVASAYIWTLTWLGRSVQNVGRTSRKPQRKTLSIESRQQASNYMTDSGDAPIRIAEKCIGSEAIGTAFVRRSKRQGSSLARK